MKKLTEEMLCLSGFRYSIYADWDSGSGTGSRLCFKSPNPLGSFYNFISVEVRDKIYLEIHKIVFDKTNNRNITESYEKIL